MGFIYGLFIYISFLVHVSNSRHYINKFAVHIPGGERVARDVAASHGHQYLGQVKKNNFQHHLRLDVTIPIKLHKPSIIFPMKSYSLMHNCIFVFKKPSQIY